MKTAKKLLALLQGFLLLNVLWYVISFAVHRSVIPRPDEVYLSFGHLYGESLVLHALASLYRVGAGISISLLLGTSLGLLMAYSPPLNRLLGPLTYLTYPIPKTALLPVVMLLFGLGDFSKVVLIILIVIFQIIVVVRDTIINLPKELYKPLLSLGASKPQILFHVTFPALLPGLLTSLRVSIGTALSVLFFTEAYGTQRGVGYYILDAWTRIDYKAMYAGILVMSLMGLFLFLILDLLEEKLCRWK